MALPYKVRDLEKVPEALRDQYEKQGEEYVLSVEGEGLETEESVAGLRSTLEKLKRDLRQAKEAAGRVSDDDLTELEQLREAKRKADEERAKNEGRWEDLRAQLQKEHQAALDAVTAQLQSRERVIEKLTVTNELQSALAKHGIKDEYRDAAEALLARRGPQVEWDGENPKGVFPDEVHGPQPIGEFVEKWAKSDAAKPFLPVQTKPGGGAGGQEGAGGKSHAGKKYSEMTMEEKSEYLGGKYAEGVPA